MRSCLEIATKLERIGDYAKGIAKINLMIGEQLIFYIIADPRTIEQANHLLWAAHNLERSADRAINICERIFFTVTGTMEEMDVEEGGSIAPEGFHQLRSTPLAVQQPPCRGPAAGGRSCPLDVLR
jgi:phosphate uptake regulator